MPIFHAVTDEWLVGRIERAKQRLVFAGPGVTKRVASALTDASRRVGPSITIILDSDEDAYRIGFGDAEGLAFLHRFASENSLPLRRQPGIRIGVLVADDDVVIWSPTARSVEAERAPNRPNGVWLHGDVAGVLDEALGGDSSTTLPSKAEIGREPLRPEQTQAMVEMLEKNPPEPFDLAQKTRVFSTRFQFVECEVRGAELTKRKIKLSSLLLNADVPEEIRDLLETQIQPFGGAKEVDVEIQALVDGRLAFDSSGTPIRQRARQEDIERAWTTITDRYLTHLKGFGWLIRRSDLERFRSAAEGYAQVLREWLAKTQQTLKRDEDHFVASVIDVIRSRRTRSTRDSSTDDDRLEDEVRKGLSRMRVIEPGVRIVVKNVSWESTRDKEFTDALRTALPAKELEGWFEEFTAARARTSA